VAHYQDVEKGPENNQNYQYTLQRQEGGPASATSNQKKRNPIPARRGGNLSIGGGGGLFYVHCKGEKKEEVENREKNISKEQGRKIRAPDQN